MLGTMLLVIVACNQQYDAERSSGKPSDETKVLATGGTYRRPLGNDPASLDPAKITDLYAVTIANQIFDGLVEFDTHTGTRGYPGH